MEQQKRCLGLLAHVDAGKTTLAEALMYGTGALRTPGRVDHGDTALDYDPMERERGITIFASQAVLHHKGWELTLLDTPGHVDFSAETERILQVLDCAVLVISAADGIQAHTHTLWHLLEHYRIPTVIFVTKMDLARRERADLMAELKTLSDRCIDLTDPEDPQALEELAMGRESVLERYLETGAVAPEDRCEMLRARELFPCWFGSGLKQQGTMDFLEGLLRLFAPISWPEAFGARVFKITHDAQGNRLTHIKLTGGALEVRQTLHFEPGEEKITQLRSYTGARFTALDRVEAGSVCAVVGLSTPENGQGLGFEACAAAPVLEPVMNYRLILPTGVDPLQLLPKLTRLQAEDPQLHLRWNPRLQQLEVGLMGRVQAEILKAMILDRFGVRVEIGEGRVLYKETIQSTVEGVGHYEPLRHYAEVHLLLEPLPRGSGLVFASSLSEDRLDRNWQRLILTHLEEKQHLGVLIGAPLTDVKLTLAAGRAHQKHTEGGDFRQATYRAVRQGLMQAESILLEPWYRFRLEVPTETIGRAITDIRARSGSFESPVDLGGISLLEGSVPVSAMNEYAAEVAAYTRGRGHLRLEPGGYAPCHNAPQVIEAVAYDPQADLDNSPDSVFCAHGAGFVVPWNQVSAHMHLESVLAPRREPVSVPKRRVRIDEKELQAILEREFGPIRRPQYSPVKASPIQETAPAALPQRPQSRYLVVDGYNVIFAWPDLAELAKADLDQARIRLMDILSNYSAFTHTETILVLDAYKVKGGTGQRFDYHGIRVVYTKENETGDAYIERFVHDIGKNEQVRVVTSDALIQVSALRSGVLRMSAAEFGRQIDEIYGDIDRYLATLHRQRMGSVGENLLPGE